jgi:hypothetical protein
MNAHSPPFFEAPLAHEVYEVGEEEMAPLQAPTRFDRAIRLNRHYRRSLGWQSYFGRIVRLLGFTNATPSEQAFANAVARWQRRQGNLSVDGTIGPQTWAQMRTVLDIHGNRPRPNVPVLCSAPADFSPAERTALEVTSRFETGVPYGCAVSRTDGISFGMLQWNLGAGTLQELLQNFDRRISRLQEFFGAETNHVRRLISLPRNQAVREALDQDLANRWRSQFLGLCADPAFCSMLQTSIRGYMRMARAATTRLGLQTVRGLTMMFDIAVGDWITPAKERAFAARIAHKQAELGGSLTEHEKLIEIAEEAATRSGNVSSDRLPRRMLIAIGSGEYRREHWELDRDFPSLNDPWMGSSSGGAQQQPNRPNVLPGSGPQQPAGAGYPHVSRFIPAKFFSRPARPRQINRIVIHITDGGSDINGTIRWFKEMLDRNGQPAVDKQGKPIKASAHYIVGQDGEVAQMVRDSDIANHAHSANVDSIGIEHVARAPGELKRRDGKRDPGLFPTQAQYCSSAALVRWLCQTYNIPIDRVHILGHAEADPRTTHKDCPNAVWEWDRYMSLVMSTAPC